jgi:hypothetical protein
MGRYINQNSKGEMLPARGKAKALLLDGATIVKPEFQENLVCVVNNGLFEAAGYCYDMEEFLAWCDPEDYKPKVWLIYDHAKELAG